jgi:hypothetical protein
MPTPTPTPTMYTLDQRRIEDGMRVWDYDLTPVTIDLSRGVDQDYGATNYWFDVRTDDGRRKTMSNDRVWLLHPTTGKEA